MNGKIFLSITLVIACCFSTMAQTPKPIAGDTLKQVIVTARKPLIEQKIDRIIVNVDAMITAAGNNTLEVLTKSPGVSIDINGNISLNGVSGVTVLIDDKPTYLSANDLAAYLRGLPGALVDKIELMSNPPAKYDAVGTAIINIRLKKNKDHGFNSSINLGYNQGDHASTDNALIANYRVKKINLFGNLTYGQDASEDKSSGERYSYTPDGTLHAAVLANNVSISRGTSYNEKIGLDYQLSSNTTAGIVLMGANRDRADRRDYINQAYGPGMQPDSVTKGYTTGQYHRNSMAINLNLQHTFPARDGHRLLTADLDQVQYNTSSTQHLPAFVYTSDGRLTGYENRQIQPYADVRIYAAKTDYTGNLGAAINLEAGLKYSYVLNDFHSDWYDYQNNQFLFNDQRSNHFIYKENINAAYVSLTKDWQRWSVKAGMRLENTNGKGHLAGNSAHTDSLFSRSYTRAFPSFYLQYKFDSAGIHRLTLSYSERIRRPNYQQLNPFLSYNDSYNYFSGNPWLAPQYSHFVELKYTYKQSLGLSVADSYSTGVIQSLLQNNGAVFISKPQNFGTTNLFNLSMYLSVSPLKWWNLNGGFSLYRQVNKGAAYGQYIYDQMTGSEFRCNNQFRFGKGWNGECNGTYIGRHNNAQFSSDPFLMLNVGLQKAVLHDKGAIRLTGNDILHQIEPGGHSLELKDAVYFSKHETDARRIGISFTYRFGKTANDRKNRHNTSSADEEQGRAR